MDPCINMETHNYYDNKNNKTVQLKSKKKPQKNKNQNKIKMQKIKKTHLFFFWSIFSIAIFNSQSAR